MPGAASGAPELRTLPAKGAPSQLRQSPSKRNGTLAPLACELWPPYRCPNPHRVCALNTGVGVLRGFLPRGLCDTGPQVVRDHRLGASSGQVSHNPKQLQSTEWATASDSARCMVVAFSTSDSGSAMGAIGGAWALAGRRAPLSSAAHPWHAIAHGGLPEEAGAVDGLTAALPP